MDSAAGVQVIRWRGQEAKTGPWRGDRTVALLSPMPGRGGPSEAFIRRCLDRLADQGFSRVITSALGPFEVGPFLGAGFQVDVRLTVLSHDLQELPAARLPDSTRIRRARPGDEQAVLEVDRLAFKDFWQLEHAGLQDALAATPHVRYRVAAEDGRVLGYAITGRAARRGFLQRLAVHPERRRQGLARGLVLDGLRWLHRWRADQVVVNTQLDNWEALALYERLGFRPDDSGLAVLSAGLPR